MEQALTVLAGRKALAKIQRDGFRPGDVNLMVGASGGARCLVLNRLDRYLFGRWLRDRSKPLHLLGSSIGSWRFACGAQQDPAAAFERFANAYTNWRSPPGADRCQISSDSREILEVMMAENSRPVQAPVSYKRWPP